MKRYAKLLQMDERGQLVIPKDVREELGLAAGAGFALYALSDEGILLVPVGVKDLRDHAGALREIEANSSRAGVSQKATEKAKGRYAAGPRHKFEEV